MIFVGIGALLIGFLTGILVMKKRYPKAGVILIDLARDADDTITIQSPKNISSWHKKKGLHFDVEVRL